MSVTQRHILSVSHKQITKNVRTTRTHNNLSTSQNIANTTLLHSYPHYISTYPHNNIKLSTPQHLIIHTITHSIKYYISLAQKTISFQLFHDSISCETSTTTIIIMAIFFYRLRYHNIIVIHSVSNSYLHTFCLVSVLHFFVIIVFISYTIYIIIRQLYHPFCII